MIVSHSMEHRDTWVIIQITDTHLMGQAEKEFVQMNPEQSFHAVIQQILLPTLMRLFIQETWPRNPNTSHTSVISAICRV